VVDTKLEHDEFAREISKIMGKLNPSINKNEFEYYDRRRKYLINPPKINLLVQVHSTIIIFECKVKRKFMGKSKQLDFHYKNINKKKLEFLQYGRLNNFDKILKMYAVKKSNKMINTETNEKFKFDPDFINNPLIILK